MKGDEGSCHTGLWAPGGWKGRLAWAGPGWGFLMKATVSIPGASGPCKNMEATIRVLL